MSTRDFGEDPDSKTLVPASLRKGAYTTDKDESLLPEELLVDPKKEMYLYVLLKL